MKKTHAFAGLVLSMALLGAGLANAFAADESLRSLADKNGIYIGAILNSQWFSGGLPGNYEQIHKQQFNIVVAENLSGEIGGGIEDGDLGIFHAGSITLQTVIGIGHEKGFIVGNNERIIHCTF